METDNAIVVLNDGETYSSLKGCKILYLTYAGLLLLDNGMDINDIPPSEIVNMIKLDK